LTPLFISDRKSARFKGEEMFERVFRSIVMMLAIGWMAPRFLSAQITPELIEAAKKEGEVMFYGAITINSSKAIGDALEKKYGIKLKH
jgi:hypothetical protein